MQLPFLSRNTQQQKFFLALLIKPYKIGAILFEEVNSKLIILAHHEVETEKETSLLTPEELLVTGDKVISYVEGSMPQGYVLEKTIFSVPYLWVDENGKIKKDHLVNLKKLCEDLGLVPVGFLMSIEAIVHFLQKNEGAPVSAVFVEVAKDEVFAYLVRGGKIVQVKSGNVEETVLLTTENLLQKIDAVDALPSKIILLDYKNVDSVEQEFLSHQWSKDIPFLHIPQVVVLEKGFENEATINGVAAQMELTVSQKVRTSNENEVVETLDTATSEDFGFVKEKDVALIKEEVGNVSEVQIDKDETLPEEHVKKDTTTTPNVSYFKGEDIDTVKEEEVEEIYNKKASGLSLVSVPSVLKNIKLPNLTSLPVGLFGGSGKIKLAIAAIAGVAIIIGFSFLYYNVLLGAKITVFADKKAIVESENVRFATSPGDGVIPIEMIEIEIEGEDTKNTTGKKETGDKAKGEVTIFNKTEDKKTFPKGTIVVGPNNLEFELLDEISVASTSPFSTSLSSAKGKVSAAKFGKEYNLPSSSNFTVKNFSTNNYIGKNQEAITGGTKKEIIVVSAKDLTDLLVAVTEKLEEDALSQGKKEADSETEIFPAVITREVIEKTYTKKEGDESGSVGVSAKVKYTLGKYSKQSLQDVVESLSRGDVPGTYALLEGESNVDITEIEVDSKDDSASAVLKVNAVYSPQIKSDELSNAIKGKSESNALEQIKKIPGVTDVSISFVNKIPLFPLVLPNNIGKISIEVKN